MPGEESSELVTLWSGGQSYYDTIFKFTVLTFTIRYECQWTVALKVMHRGMLSECISLSTCSNQVSHTLPAPVNFAFISKLQ